MDIRHDSTLAIGAITGRFTKDAIFATFIAKATFLLLPDGTIRLSDQPMLLSGDIGSVNDRDGSFSYPSDFVTYKPRADLLVVGTARSPEARPVSRLDVRFRVGALNKRLSVFGVRTWTNQQSTGAAWSLPRPFVSMPLTYERAFGGPAFPKNPIGEGYASERAPAIEDPRRLSKGPTDSIDPAGFGPLRPDWEPRRSMIGTYDNRWLKERWPWFPEDFDWGYFNSAPRDQQIDGYLRGDEDLEFENMHAVHPIYRSRLTGLRARCFVSVRLPSGVFDFREVPLNLDTLWVNMDEGRLILVWRGLTEVGTLKMKEVEAVFAFTEPLCESPRSLPEYRVFVEQRFLKNEASTLIEPGETPVEAAYRAALDKALGDMEKDVAVAAQDLDQAEAAAARIFAEQKAELVRAGVNSNLMEPVATPAPLPDVREQLRVLIAEIEKTDLDQAARLSPLFVGIETTDYGVEQIAKEFAGLEGDFSGTENERVDETRPRWTRESVLTALLDRQSFVLQDLSGLDLSGISFAHTDLTGVLLKDANLEAASLSGTKLVGADLTGANLTQADISCAALDGVDFSDAKLSGANFIGASIKDAVFSRLDMQDTDFSRCFGRGADFSNANLTRAIFDGANLPQSDFSQSTVTGASFRGASLHAARFDGARGNGIQMEGADITGLRGGEKADFSAGNFQHVSGAGSIWEDSNLDGADFSNALLIRAQFSEASLRGAHFDRANLESAVFEDAVLYRAVMTNANFLRATFDRADLSEADATGSNFFEAGFWEALIHTDFRNSNFKGTLLAQGHGYRTTNQR